jgi:serine/threonine-protein kinase
MHKQMELQENLVVADRFRLVRMIGRGGMGSVWQAVHIALDQPCAVKFIEGELANVAEAHARFEREAKAAAQLRSPHVVQILDHGVWQGRPYIAMELLDGEDLAKALAKAGGKLPPAQVNAIVQQVCRALTKAHQVGIVHRDLKPDNIFLVNDDDRQIVKILDFGVAKQRSQVIDGTNTKTGVMLGTPYYMSPEQAQGIKTVDARSDLWSLAVIVYQCITGKLPFESEALGDLLVKIIVSPIPVPSQVAAVPPGFDEWWAKAAQRAPENRFQTAKDFANALALALGVTVSEDSIRTSALTGTVMLDPAAPQPFQPTPPNLQPAVSTPQPANPTPSQANVGGPAGRPSSPSLPAVTPPNPVPAPVATFSGVEPPVVLPKKGLSVGVIIAGIGGFVLLAVVGVGVIAMKGSSASATAPTSSVASTPTPPTSSDSTSASGSGSGSAPDRPASDATAAPTTTGTPETAAATSAADALDASASATPTARAGTPKPRPTGGGGGRVTPTPATPKSSSAAPSATAKPWNPGF